MSLKAIFHFWTLEHPILKFHIGFYHSKVYLYVYAYGYVVFYNKDGLLLILPRSGIHLFIMPAVMVGSGQFIPSWSLLWYILGPKYLDQSWSLWQWTRFSFRESLTSFKCIKLKPCPHWYHIRKSKWTETDAASCPSSLPLTLLARRNLFFFKHWAAMCFWPLPNLSGFKMWSPQQQHQGTCEKCKSLPPSHLVNQKLWG